jgi:protein ImuB
MNRVLCIHLPNWPVQQVVAAKPELKGRAILLYAPAPRRGEQIVACSTAAAQRGVRIGMPLTEAKVITRSSDPLLLPHRPDADREALVRLAQWCEQFSPVVGLELAEEPTDLLLDMTGLTSLFGGEAALAQHVLQEFFRLAPQAPTPSLAHASGYDSQQTPSVLAGRFALADTIGAAWAIARYARCDSFQFTTHNLHFAISARPICKILSPLPVEALRLSPENVILLRELGLQQIGDLLPLPRESLASRFGEEVALRLDQACGNAKEIIAAEQPPADFHARISLEHPTDSRKAIEQLLANLVEQVATLLAEREEGVLQLHCQLDCGGVPVLIQVGLFQPTATADHLLSLVQMQLEQMRLPRPVTGGSATAITTAPLTQRQRDLFAEQSRDRPRELAVLIDRLSSRLGREQVLGPRPQASAAPEHAFRYAPLAGQQNGRGWRVPKSNEGRARKRKAKSPRSARSSGTCHTTANELTPNGRPLKLFSPPQRLAVIAVIPDGPPARFSFQNRHYHIAFYFGPERIETGWWRGRSIRRDYYRVETDRGTRFWLFRRLTDGHWFLHGEFT